MSSFRELGSLKEIDIMRSLKSCGMAAAFLGLCAVAIGMVGCKAEAAKSTGFTNTAAMDKDPSLPFQKSWIKPGFDKSRYTKLYVAPVNTAYMLKMTDWQKGMRKEQIEADTAKLALYAQDAIKRRSAKIRSS